MSHVGYVYFVIPLGYVCLFVLLLIAAVIASFSRTRRYIADYLLVGTLMTVPGIVVAWLLAIPYFRWADHALKGGRLDPSVSMAIILMPFLIALTCLAGSFWLGATLASRRRKRIRGRP